MISVVITREISAMHVLDDEPKCGRFHGHNYKFEVTVSSEKLNADGMVVNFDEVKRFIDHYDHTLILPQSNIRQLFLDTTKVILNHREYEIPNSNISYISRSSATAENIALQVKEDLLKKFPDFEVKIKLWETSSSYVEV